MSCSSRPPTGGFFKNFTDLAAHLEHLGLFRIRPELGQLRDTLGRLAPPRPTAAIQVVGTNGKGSTATFIESIARAHGLTTGLYTSPHFVSFRERIRLNGIPVTEDALLEPANRIMDAGGEKLTYFEFVTVLAALVFSPQAVDIAVMETGLGGTWDAVTALPADAVAFTPIGLDHCQYLGETVAAIAADKAGAIREGKPAFSAPQAPEAHRSLEAVAAARGVLLTVCGGREALPPRIRDGEIALGLFGEHQFVNAALALASWRHLAREHGWMASPEKETAGLAAAFIPGRMQFVPASARHGHPALLLDGAHNAHGMAALGRNLACANIAPAAVIFSCLEDKNPNEMAAHLRVLATGPVFVPLISNNPRAMPPEVLAEAIGLSGTPVRDMAEALVCAKAHVEAYMPAEAAAYPHRHPVLVCGSLYMLGDFFALRPDCLAPTAGRRGPA